ncbi:phosphatidate phosphatase App1 family protein [Dokdonella koreensis]|uniref:Phosphatidate phosphatase APP1 catalytic domain-containing protein n=1 Tax=Dokdonella koreensis DS-123 TaxID=1300342 RepID=A0A160DY60_9GAMM|nr:App1 family protein [Dokdonella koreensis]ANB18953.1 Hypothetical protein I596_2960 [Dokdonella koreensis DS-123]
MRRVETARAGLRRLSAAALALLAGASPLAARPLAGDEQVLFVPGIARPLEAGRIEVAIDAWVYEREERPRLAAAFARYIGFDLATATAADRERFEQRTRLFLVDSENRKRLDVAFPGGLRVTLPRTRHGGRSTTRVTMDGGAIAADVRWVDFHAVLPPADARRFAGRALWVPARGLSVVSDIDDTIKDSGVADRRTLLLNSFVHPFKAVPGMADRYRQLAAAPGLRFHYVSGSPIQLLAPLTDFLAAAGFPDGSMHLREATAWRTLVPREGASEAHKLGVLRRLLADLPHRDFVLVGDATEADPEIYATLAREQPDRVCAILIRDPGHAGRDASRYRSAFAGIAPERWRLFDTIEDVAAPLDRCVSAAR